MHSCRLRPCEVALDRSHSSIVDVRGVDHSRVPVVGVDVVGGGGGKTERIVLQIGFKEAESLGGLGTDQLFDRFELELIVVVLRRDQLVERLGVGGVIDVLTNGFDEQFRPSVSKSSAIASNRSTRYVGDWK